MIFGIWHHKHIRTSDLMNWLDHLVLQKSEITQKSKFDWVPHFSFATYRISSYFNVSFINTDFKMLLSIFYMKSSIELLDYSTWFFYPFVELLFVFNSSFLACFSPMYQYQNSFNMNERGTPTSIYENFQILGL